MTVATQTLYDWLLFLHVLAAMVWVGGGVMLAAIAASVLRDPDPAAIDRFARNLRVLGPLVLAPATVSVVGLGVGLVVDSDAWDFGQLWVQLGLGLFAAAFVIGAAWPKPDSAGGRASHRATPRRRGAPAAAPLVVGLRADRPAARRRRLGHDDQTGAVSYADLSGAPRARCSQHACGFERYLDQIAARVTGSDPPPEAAKPIPEVLTVGPPLGD